MQACNSNFTAICREYRPVNSCCFWVWALVFSFVLLLMSFKCTLPVYSCHHQNHVHQRCWQKNSAFAVSSHVHSKCVSVLMIPAVVILLLCFDNVTQSVHCSYAAMYFILKQTTQYSVQHCYKKCTAKLDITSILNSLMKKQTHRDSSASI